MAYTILIFAYRKPGTSPAAFRAHYETSHVPLIQRLTGSNFPQSHKRLYVQRSEVSSDEHADPQPISHPAPVLVGNQSDFEYDAFAELTFEDMAAFQNFMGIVGQENAARRLAEDEELFLDRKRTTAVVVGEITETIGTSTSA